MQSDIDNSVNVKSSFHRFEIGFGLENYTKSKGINGGNYFYGDFHYQIISRLAVGAKISTDLTPSSFDDAITHLGLRYNTQRGMRKFYKKFGLNYVHNLNDYKTSNDFVGFDVSLLTMKLSKHKNHEFDFMPITLLYSIDSNDFSIIYTFLRFKIKF